MGYFPLLWMISLHLWLTLPGLWVTSLHMVDLLTFIFFCVMGDLSLLSFLRYACLFTYIMVDLLIFAGAIIGDGLFVNVDFLC